jgi:hypothetical protein
MIEAQSMLYSAGLTADRDPQCRRMANKHRSFVIANLPRNVGHIKQKY